MPSWLLWLVPVPLATLAAVAWTAWAGRPRRPESPEESMRAHERFRAALGPPGTAPPVPAPRQRTPFARPRSRGTRD